MNINKIQDVVNNELKSIQPNTQITANELCKAISNAIIKAIQEYDNQKNN